MQKRKPDPRRKGAIEVLMTPEERAELDAGASADSLPLSTWLRTLGLRESRKRKRREEAR